MDFDGFVHLFSNSDGVQKPMIEMIAENFLRCPIRTNAYNYITTERIREIVANKSVEELKQFLSLCIVVRVITDVPYRPNPEQNALSKLEIFSNWIREWKNTFIVLINQEKARVEQKYSGFIAGNYIKMREFASGNYARDRVIEEIVEQKLNEEQLGIVSLIESMMPKVEKLDTSSYETVSYPTGPPNVQVPKEFVTFANEQDEKIKQTSGNFREQMEKRKQQRAFEKQKKYSSVLIEPTQLPVSEEVVSSECLEKERLRKEQQERFEKDVLTKKTDYEKSESEMIAEKIKHDKEADFEFQKVFDKQKKENEEAYKKVLEEIKEYEKETQRLLEERRQMWRVCIEVFSACAYKQQLFEEKEKEWADWLDSLKSSISNVKTRFGLFDKIIRNISKNENSYEKIFRKELLALHASTISAYDLLFEACGTVKKLDSQFPDGVFLHILHKKLVKVTNKLCKSLEDIDESLNKETAETIDKIAASFADLKTSDIPTTGELRKESSSFVGSAQIDEDPRVYAQQSSEIIEEIIE